VTVTQVAIYRFFKYAVYSLLALNVWFFFTDEWSASAHRFADGIALGDIIEGFASSIDTAAWVILLLMFELETCVLEERHFTRRVTWTLHGLRAACYLFIVYAFYGYVSKLMFLSGAAPLPGVRDLCALVGDHWVYARGLDDYAVLTADNCAAAPAAAPFVQLPAISAVAGASGYTEIVRLAWVDVVNAAVWLAIVVLLEVDVYLQARDRLHGAIATFSACCKYVLYSTLLVAAVYWGVKGDFVDFWDAFLWLVAFAFIEMNFFEWQQAMHNAAATAG